MTQLQLFPTVRVRLRFPLDGEQGRTGTLTRRKGWYYYVTLDHNNSEIELYPNEFDAITEEEN